MSICVYGPTVYMILKGVILLYNTYWPVQCRPTVQSLYILIGLDPFPTPPKNKVIHNYQRPATFQRAKKKSLPPIAPPKAPTYPLLSPPLRSLPREVLKKPAIKTPRPHRRRRPGGLRGYKHLRCKASLKKAEKWG